MLYCVRKNRIFSKNRYSRYRQSVRVIVYLALLVNILLVVGIYLLFYNIIFNLASFWWLYGLFLFFLIVPYFLNCLVNC